MDDCGDLVRVDCFVGTGRWDYFFRDGELVALYLRSDTPDFCDATSPTIWYGEVAGGCAPPG